MERARYIKRLDSASFLLCPALAVLIKDREVISSNLAVREASFGAFASIHHLYHGTNATVAPIEISSLEKSWNKVSLSG